MNLFSRQCIYVLTPMETLLLRAYSTRSKRRYTSYDRVFDPNEKLYSK